MSLLVGVLGSESEAGSGGMEWRGRGGLGGSVVRFGLGVAPRWWWWAWVAAGLEGAGLGFRGAEVDGLGAMVGCDVDDGLCFDMLLIER